MKKIVLALVGASLAIPASASAQAPALNSAQAAHLASRYALTHWQAQQVLPSYSAAQGWYDGTKTIGCVRFSRYQIRCVINTNARYYYNGRPGYASCTGIVRVTKSRSTGRSWVTDPDFEPAYDCRSTVDILDPNYNVQP